MHGFDDTSNRVLNSYPKNEILMQLYLLKYASVSYYSAHIICLPTEDEFVKGKH